MGYSTEGSRLQAVIGSSESVSLCPKPQWQPLQLFVFLHFDHSTEGRSRVKDSIRLHRRQTNKQQGETSSNVLLLGYLD